MRLVSVKNIFLSFFFDKLPAFLRDERNLRFLLKKTVRVESDRSMNDLFSVF